MWRRFSGRLTGLALAGLLAPALLLAQASFTGTILGTVTDTTRGVIPGADVTVTNLGTNESRVVQTDRSGTYVVPNLKPGTYRLEVSAGGFRTFK